MVDSKSEEIRNLLINTSHWNGGAGLIIPAKLAEKLKAMNIEGPYTVPKPVPKLNK